MVQPLWKTIGQFLQKLNIKLPYDPAIPLAGVPKKSKRGIQTGTFISMFMVLSFTIAKRWKQPKCPSTDCG